MAVIVATTVTVRPEFAAKLAYSPTMRRVLERQADRISAELRAAAPVKTGAGRASIRTRTALGPTGWEASASWDAQHYYLGIQNTRTHWAEQVVQRLRNI